MPQRRSRSYGPRPPRLQRSWRSRLRNRLRSNDFWVRLLVLVVGFGLVIAIVKLLADVDSDGGPLPSREPPPIRAPGISQPLTPPDVAGA